MSSEMDDADTDEIPQQGSMTATVEAVCVCGALVAVSEDEPPAVLHALPQCKDFEERDALDYLRWLNERLEARSDA